MREGEGLCSTEEREEEEEEMGAARWIWIWLWLWLWRLAGLDWGGNRGLCDGEVGLLRGARSLGDCGRGRVGWRLGAAGVSGRTNDSLLAR